MANGHPAYHGPVSGLCDFFVHVGIPVPESYNPADHAISQLAITENKEKDITRVEAITRLYEQSANGRQMAKFVKRAASQPSTVREAGLDSRKKKRGYAVSFFTQMSVLLRRAFLTTLRDPVLLKVRAFQVISTALIIGIVNWQLPVTAAAVQNIEGTLYNSCRDMNFLFLFPSINVSLLLIFNMNFIFLNANFD